MNNHPEINNEGIVMLWKIQKRTLVIISENGRSPVEPPDIESIINFY
jgi:hypothetical protein